MFIVSILSCNYFLRFGIERLKNSYIIYILISYRFYQSSISFWSLKCLPFNYEYVNVISFKGSQSSIRLLRFNVNHPQSMILVVIVTCSRLIIVSRRKTESPKATAVPAGTFTFPAATGNPSISATVTAFKVYWNPSFSPLSRRITVCIAVSS